MNQAVATISSNPAGGLVKRMAGRFGVDETKLLSTLKNTAFKMKNGEATNEQMMALMVVADQLVAILETKYSLSDEQKAEIMAIGNQEK